MASGNLSSHGHQLTRPAELFRADLISAMKLPDSHQLEPNTFVEIREPWRTEWEVGVQVCVTPNQLPQPNVKILGTNGKLKEEMEQKKNNKAESIDDVTPCERVIEEHQSLPQYDIDELDIAWLDSINQKRKYKAISGAAGLTEEVLKEAITVLETKCQQNMTRAVATEKVLGIEYDDSTVCDVCRDPDREDSNEMIFCDLCNICVHQACYGVASIPRGSWVCKPCSAQLSNVSCVLCPNRGGALKRTRPGPGWAHMSCALWIPEVKIGSPDKMEPITNIEAIPASRWNLVCCVCRKKQGACIQCSYPSCMAAYHVTCAFHSGLKTSSNIQCDHVVHESYCPKHTAVNRTPGRDVQSSHTVKTPGQLRMVEETFYEYTNPEELRGDTKLPAPLCSLLYNYWKLKRRAGHNKPLLPGLPVETALHSLRREICTNSPVTLSNDEHFPMVINLRQNLETVRNLVYMVQRRERLKKQLLITAMDVLHCEMLEEEEAQQDKVDSVGGAGDSITSTMVATTVAASTSAVPTSTSTASSSSSSSSCSTTNTTTSTTNTTTTTSTTRVTRSLQPSVSVTRLSTADIKDFIPQRKTVGNGLLKKNSVLDNNPLLNNALAEEPLQRRRLRSSLDTQDDSSLEHNHKKQRRKISDSLTNLSSRYTTRGPHLADKRVAV